LILEIHDELFDPRVESPEPNDGVNAENTRGIEPEEAKEKGHREQAAMPIPKSDLYYTSHRYSRYQT